MKKVKKKVVRKLKWKSLFKLLSIFIIIFIIIIYKQNISTKRIIIIGNTIYTDNEIISLSGYKYYPKLYSKTKSQIESDIKNELKGINKITVKRYIDGTLKLIIDEAKPLFYNRSNSSLVFSNKVEVDTLDLYGVPVLVNYVPKEQYDKLIDKMNGINRDIISLISEIEYSPWISGNTTIDDERFILRMNDQNNVYVNLININKLNEYINIYATLGDKKGTLYLDSSSDKISFSSYQ